MSQDGQTLKEPYIAKGLCIMTGEMLPEVAQSRIARAVTVRIKKGSINLSNLSEIQAHTEELSFCMMNFIRWIIDNENAVIEYAKSLFIYNRQQNDDNVHGRTSEISNILPIGFTLFTLFAQQQGVISENEKNNLDNKMTEVINNLVQEQTQEVKELKPTEMFYTALDELIQTHSISVYNLKNNGGSLSGKEVGYYDPTKECLYLYPNAIYNEVVSFYNNKFPVPQNTLWRYMSEEGLLYQNDKRRFKVSRVIKGKTKSVIEIKTNGLNCLKEQQFNS